MTSVVRFIRIASFVICAIVVVSFMTFAITQTRSASGRQTEEISGRAGATQSSESSNRREGRVHRTLEEASNGLTAPFAGIVSSANSEWASRGVRLLLALAVYGFGLGYLARVLRVRM
jgi:hypothetical protein